jgi:hypothetical protein
MRPRLATSTRAAMSSSTLHDYRLARGGGLFSLQRLFGLWQDEEELCRSDAIIVSFDIEMSAADRRKIFVSSKSPVVKEFGVATLDTRDFFNTDKKVPNLSYLVKVKHFAVTDHLPIEAGHRRREQEPCAHLCSAKPTRF